MMQNENNLSARIKSFIKGEVKNAYEQIKTHKGVPKFNGYQIWLDFFAENDYVENFDDSMAELEIP